MNLHCLLTVIRYLNSDIKLTLVRSYSTRAQVTLVLLCSVSVQGMYQFCSISLCNLMPETFSAVALPYSYYSYSSTDPIPSIFCQENWSCLL